MQSNHLSHPHNEFRLTDAVRPAPGVPNIPRQGYRLGLYRDKKAGLRVPVLAASVSRERLFDAFLDLLAPLGPVADVVLETSHDSRGNEHRDWCRQHIDLPVLQSHFCDFEELLVHDGCTGVAVIATAQPIEVQFDEHKLLIAYARDLAVFEAILQSHGVERDQQMTLISEGEHLHHTEPHYRAAFEQLCQQVGVIDAAEHVNW